MVSIFGKSRHLWTNQCTHQRSQTCFYCSAYNLDLSIMGYPEIVEDAMGVMYLIFTHMAYSLFHGTFIIYRTTPSRLAPSSNTGTLFKVCFCLFFFCLNLITSTLKQDDLAAAFSTTSLTELQ